MKFVFYRLGKKWDQKKKKKTKTKTKFTAKSMAL